MSGTEGGLTTGPVELSRRRPGGSGEQLGPFWTVRQVLTATGIANSDTLIADVENGQLLAVFAGDGALLFPSWQFAVTGDCLQLKPSLAPVLKILRGHAPWSIARVLLVSDAPELGGRSAVQVADAGDPRLLLAPFARQVDRIWRKRSEQTP